MPRMKLTEKQKRAVKRRLLNFETFDGAFILVPWGLGFIYCGLFDLRLGYAYAMVTTGITLVIWGIRKASVDRVKLKVRHDRMVKEFLADEGR